jgi:translation elongation factor P/translation initiation factor 5A
MAALIDAIDVKRKTFFEFENTPFLCLEAEVSTPTARGAQTLVRLKMRNLLTRAVFDKTRPVTASKNLTCKRLRPLTSIATEAVFIFSTRRASRR